MTAIFIVFCIFFIILPGYALVNFTQKDHNDILVVTGLAFVTGVVLFTVCSLMSGRLLFLLPLVSAAVIDTRRKTPRRQTLQKQSWPVIAGIVAIITAGAVSQTLLFQGALTYTDQGMVFPALHDVSWNASIVQSLLYHVPPVHPGLAGTTLKNHHFLYHLFLASTSQLTKVDVLNLYYYFGPLLVSILYGLSLYAVSTVLIKSNVFRGVAVFIGYFSGNAAYVLPFLFGSSVPWGQNTFFVDQPLDQMMNPYTIFGFALVLCASYCLCKAYEHQRIHKMYLCIAAVFFGICFGYKSFGGVLSILSLCLAMFLISILQWNFKWLWVAIFSLVVFVPVFSLIADTSSSGMTFMPGWILTEMMQGSDKLHMPAFVLKEQFYMSTQNTFGLAKIKILELIIYLAGNYATRILGIVMLVWVTFKTRSYIHVFFLVTSVLAIALPVLFQLKNKPFDIIQFAPYACVILALYVTLGLEKLSNRFGKKNVYISGLIAMYVVLMLPTSAKYLYETSIAKKEIIPHDEVQALQYLHSMSQPDDTVLIHPDDYGPNPMYITAVSGRRLYIGSREFVTHTGQNAQIQNTVIENFFSGKVDKEQLRTQNTRYIYIPKSKIKHTIENRWRDQGVEAVYENQTIAIYEVKDL